ncbi:GL10083 [Drosophila persimilis]|uniref:GL10083 n=1 Tax=Drosophila persimilis TaxID=7234 RepID=B4H5B1_DROPE|nr:GL10083 [Drosophila persimilis]
MRLAKCLCCIPLRVGVILTGCLFGATDLIIGSYGLYMVIRREFPDNVVEFFRTMDTLTCVACFTGTFYLMAFQRPDAHLWRHQVVLSYCMFVVNSFYDELTEEDD